MIIEILTLILMIVSIMCGIYVIYNKCDNDYDKFDSIERKWVSNDKI